MLMKKLVQKPIISVRRNDWQIQGTAKNTLSMEISNIRHRRGSGYWLS